jgi:hypothetical protein
MNHDIYIVIGNTGGKLSPDEWQSFQTELKEMVEPAAEKVWGTWYSDPATPFRNMCIGILLAEEGAVSLRAELARLAAKYGQDSIAWSRAETEFIQPKQD